VVAIDSDAPDNYPSAQEAYYGENLKGENINQLLTINFRITTGHDFLTLIYIKLE